MSTKQIVINFDHAQMVQAIKAVGNVVSKRNIGRDGFACVSLIKTRGIWFLVGYSDYQIKAVPVPTISVQGTDSATITMMVRQRGQKLYNGLFPTQMARTIKGNRLEFVDDGLPSMFQEKTSGDIIAQTNNKTDVNAFSLLDNDFGDLSVTDGHMFYVDAKIASADFNGGWPTGYYKSTVLVQRASSRLKMVGYFDEKNKEEESLQLFSNSQSTDFNVFVAPKYLLMTGKVKGRKTAAGIVGEKLYVGLLNEKSYALFAMVEPNGTIDAIAPMHVDDSIATTKAKEVKGNIIDFALQLAGIQEEQDAKTKENKQDDKKEENTMKQEQKPAAKSEKKADKPMTLGGKRVKFAIPVPTDHGIEWMDEDQIDENFHDDIVQDKPAKPVAEKVEKAAKPVAKSVEKPEKKAVKAEKSGWSVVIVPPLLTVKQIPALAGLRVRPIRDEKHHKVGYVGRGKNGKMVLVWRDWYVQRTTDEARKALLKRAKVAA